MSNAYRPEFWAACSRTLDLVANGTIGTDGITETGLKYTLMTYANGDVLSNCSQSVGSAESAASSNYYPNITVGSDTGGCSVTVDYPPFNDNVAGYWYYKVESSALKAVYKDVSSHPLNGFAYVFGENDCNVFRADAVGMWKDASLGDMLD